MLVVVLVVEASFVLVEENVLSVEEVDVSGVVVGVSVSGIVDSVEVVVEVEVVVSGVVVVVVVSVVVVVVVSVVVVVEVVFVVVDVSVVVDVDAEVVANSVLNVSRILDCNVSGSDLADS